MFFTETHLLLTKRKGESILYLSQQREDLDMKIITSTCVFPSSIDPLKNISDLVDAVHFPWFDWCCDTGHIHGFGTGIRELEEVSRVPKMLHIQDNNGVNRDDHMIPFDGSIDWYECMRILKKIDYQGDFTLEAHHKCQELPDEMRDSHLTELLMRSRKLAAYYDSL